MIQGFQPVFSSDVPLTSITERSTSTSTSGSITLPTGAAEGDFVIITEVIRDNNGATPATTTPSGWDAGTGGDQLNSGNATNSVRFHTYWKILTAADVAAGSVSGASGLSTTLKRAICFKPNNGARISGYTLAVGNVSPASADPPSINVDATGAATPNVLLGVVACSDAVTPNFSTQSPALATSYSQDRQRVSYTINASTSYTLDMNDLGGRNHLVGALFTFS